MGVLRGNAFESTDIVYYKSSSLQGTIQLAALDSWSGRISVAASRTARKFASDVTQNPIIASEWPTPPGLSFQDARLILPG